MQIASCHGEDQEFRPSQLGASRPYRSADGFSLIEVLVSVMILGLALVGLTQGITTALKGSKDAELQTNAALLAAARIETLRAGNHLVNGQQTGQGSEELSIYRWTESVKSTDIENLHEVTVTIEHSQTGKQLYQLKTLLFDAPTGTNSWSTTSGGTSTR